MNKRRKIANRGEYWTINDKRTRGHTSFIVRGNRKRKRILHLPLTHTNRTRRINNQRLLQNPNPFDLDEFNNLRDSYILTKIQSSSENSLGLRRKNFKIKNTIDNSIVRKIIKRNKKR